ncbi:hypothetical protein R1flu_021669 [Riccia fluitans]|uniref:LOB domain-containing protein n=1 Tax=Riccia fluitans TaxID=41844 RepID=A0ABD1ZS20_9MARC
MEVPNIAACAACRHQRRRCSEECPLARWFPPFDPQRFWRVNKLFGLKNVLRMIEENPGNVEGLMRSLVYEAEARERDPVRGACGVVQTLEQQADQLRTELKLAKEKLKSIQSSTEGECSKLEASPSHCPR